MFVEILLILLLGLIFGSSLNSIGFRLPLILNYERKSPHLPSLNLFWPRSFCSSCGKQISWINLIPVYGFLRQRGSCNFCKKKITLEYPFTEIICSLLFIALYFKYGLLSINFYLHLILFLNLILISKIDLNFFKIPFFLNLLILFNVCLINSDTIFQTLLFILITFLALLFVSIVFKILRSREGLGMGDVLLISFLSGLFELEKIPLLILFSSVSGIFFYVVMTYIKNKRNFEIAFGPHIALSGIWMLFIL